MSGKPRITSIFLAALLSCSAVGVWADASVLTTQAPQVVTGEQSVALQVAPGSYVEGVLDAGNHVYDLFLEDQDGAVERRLLSNISGLWDFRFVATDRSHRLRVVPEAAGAKAEISLSRNLPLEAQLPQEPVEISRTPQSPRLQQLLATGTQEGVEAFWREIAEQGTPLVEPSTAGDADRRLITFLWRGAKHNVRLVGGPAQDHVWLKRLDETDIWFASFDVPEDIRLSYRLAPDIPRIPGNRREQRMALLATLQADPLNKNGFGASNAGSFERKSYIALPAAPKRQAYESWQGPKGRVERKDFGGQGALAARRLWYYQPAEFHADNPENLLLFLFDGRQYQTQVSVPDLLDFLIGTKQLPPVAAVLIDSVDPDRRGKDLPCNPDFQEVMAEAILPEAQTYFGMRPAAARTVVAGSSYGGLAATCLALTRPEAFGSFLSLSGSFWWQPKGYAEEAAPYIETLAANASSRDLKAFLSAGIYEASRGPGDAGILETTKSLAAAMRAGGYQEVRTRFYTGGHDYAVWEGAIADGLLALFGVSDGKN